MNLNVIHLVSNPVWGGGERYVLDLCKTLRQHGHSVAVVTRGKEAVDSRFKAEGFEPGRLRLGGVFDFLSPVMLAKVFNRLQGPVTVHVHNFKDAATALRARKLSRIPGNVHIVATRHLVKAAKTSRSAQNLYNSLDAIVFVSQTALDGFLSSSPTVDASRLHVVANAIPAPRTTPLSKPADELRLVFAGRLSPEKGLENLLDAFAGMTADAVLHISGTGRGQYVQSLVRRMRSLGIENRVVFHGHLADPLPLMASADIAVAPSQAVESFGLSVLEFMHLGVPVVSTCYGGPSEIITDGHDGLLVDCTDTRALHTALNRLAGDIAMRRRMGANAAATAAGRFSYDTFYNSITAIYDSLETH